MTVTAERRRAELSIEPSNECLQGKTTGEVIVLTGVTGTLGVHIFNQLRSLGQVAEIHCLIRGADQHAAGERLRKALTSKQLAPISESSSEIYCHTCRLTDSETLGIDPAIFENLLQKVTLIIHAAWTVNFNLPLTGFENQLQSLQNLLSLPARSYRQDPPSILFCSSTASVLGPATKPISCAPNIAEKIYEDPNSASPVGYAKSKWVAERVCKTFHCEHGVNVAVARIGQLCGDENTGTWNVTEAWPLMLSSAKVIGALPKLVETLNWLKVDIAAQAVVEIGLDLIKQRRRVEDKETTVPVYHVINANTRPKWEDLLGWMKRYKPDLGVLSPHDWVERLEGLTGDAKDHPARKLLGLWKTAYCGPEAQEKGDDPVFEMEKTLKVASMLRDVKPLDEAYFAKVWAWIEREV